MRGKYSILDCEFLQDKLEVIMTPKIQTEARGFITLSSKIVSKGEESVNKGSWRN